MNDALLYFIVHRSDFIVSAHDAIFAGFCGALVIDAVTVPPLRTPKLTTNSAASPIAVERVAWI